MSDRKFDLRVTIMATGDTGFRMSVGLSSLSPRALRLLARVDPRITDSDFHSLASHEKIVQVHQRTMLEVSGGVGRSMEPYPGSIIPSEMTPGEPALKLTTYGHPRNEETFLKWLDGCAGALATAQQARKSKLDELDRRLDKDIDGWVLDLRRQALKDIDSVVELRQDGDRGWAIRWSTVRMRDKHVENDMLKSRLLARVREAGYETLRDFLNATENGAEIVRIADRRVAEMVLEESPAPGR